jgi:hypothetical protein
MGRALWAACAVAAACAVGAWGAHAGAAATASVAERLRTASGEPVRSRPLGAGATPTDLREAEPQGPPEGGPDAQVPFDRLDLDRDGTITRSEWEKYYADHPQKDEITVGAGGAREGPRAMGETKRGGAARAVAVRRRRWPSTRRGGAGSRPRW